MFKNLYMSKILKSRKIGKKQANFKWSYLGYFSTFLGSVKFLMGLNLLGLLMNMVTKPSGPTFVVRWSLNMGRSKIMKISRIFKFLKNTEKRSSRFFYFLSHHICWGLGQKNPKKIFTCFLLQSDKVGMVRFWPDALSVAIAPLSHNWSTQSGWHMKAEAKRILESTETFL